MQKTLIKTNKYLKNPKKRRDLIISHAAASAKIEGIDNAKKRAELIGKKIFKTFS